MTEKTKCQCCGNSFDIDSDQAICVESFGECIFCRFSPNSKGSKSGTQAELSEIVVKQEVKRRFKNQQPNVIDMEKFVAGPVVVPTQETNFISAAIANARVLKHRIHELEGELLGYKKIIANQDAMLERQTSRIVDLHPWVGLTDEEALDCAGWSVSNIARNAEAKLKEKNT